MDKVVDAHTQLETRHYTMHFPEHGPRVGDPHYIDFDHYRKTHVDTATCAYKAYTSGNQCIPGLELHHKIIEFSLTNGVDFASLELDFPGISDPTTVGAWVESDQNFEWYCPFHHRGHGGVHIASASDFEAEKYVKGLIS
jgi:hypothetical protein